MFYEFLFPKLQRLSYPYPDPNKDGNRYIKVVLRFLYKRKNSNFKKVVYLKLYPPKYHKRDYEYRKSV